MSRVAPLPLKEWQWAGGPRLAVFHLQRLIRLRLPGCRLQNHRAG